MVGEGLPSTPASPLWLPSPLPCEEREQYLQDEGRIEGEVEVQGHVLRIGLLRVWGNSRRRRANSKPIYSILGRDH